MAGTDDNKLLQSNMLDYSVPKSPKYQTAGKMYKKLKERKRERKKNMIRKNLEGPNPSFLEFYKCIITR